MIPKFNETMLPILKIISDGKEHTLREVTQKLYEIFNVTKEERNMRIGNGSGLFDNKVGWGKSYLRQAGLINIPRRGYFNITEEGEKILQQNPKEITVASLKKYKKFQNFISPKEKKVDQKIDNSYVENLSPTELIEKGYNKFSETLKSALLDQLKNTDPYYFEKIILVLFQQMGYGDFEETSKSGDGGIDGIINQDQLGIERIYTQAKRYTDSKVGERDIRNFIGAMSGDVSKGIFVTTSDFNQSAIDKVRDARNHKIRLINGEELVELMIKFNVGVQLKYDYKIKEIDIDFFEDNN